MLVLWASGCTSGSDDGASGGGGAGGSSNGNAAAACPQLANEAYGVLERCAPQLIEADKATMLAGLQRNCEAKLNLRGVIPTEVTTCFTKQGSQSCNDFFNTTCAPRGTLPDGSACADGAQCASGVCTAEQNSCGQCSSFAKEGEACNSNDPCAPGLLCGEGKCRPRAKLGEACDEVGFECEAPLVCLEKKCAQATGEGGDCPSHQECDDYQDLRCDFVQKKCKKATRAKVGEPCGVLVGGDFVECEAIAYCQQPDIKTAGSCQLKKKLGEACGPDDYCLDVLFCDGGKCQQFDPASCQ